MTGSPKTLRTHEMVLAHIEDELIGGRLRIGGKLPAERTLAGQLGVSRPSIREAVRILEALGVIRTGTGSGPDSGAVIVADPSAGIGAALRMHLASSHLPIEDLVQTRILLEAWTTREAAVQQDRAQLAVAAGLLDAMDAPSLPAPEFNALDADFHVALAGATGNQVVSATMSALRGAIESYVLAAVPQLPDWTRTSRRLRRQHRAILTAIEAGDGELASRLVVRHIKGFYAEAKLGNGVTR
jgi:GntR family transcriptional repressor for pyruvate dehydrogenase complex